MKNKFILIFVLFIISTVFGTIEYLSNIKLKKEIASYQNYCYSADALLERSKSLFEMNITGVLHIGAHAGEEIDLYKRLGIDKVIYVEANPNFYQKLLKNVNKRKQGITISTYNFAASEKEEKMPFYVTNNGQSSSLLKLKNHKILHPSIHEVETIMVDAKPIDLAIPSHDLKNVNMLILDIQGSELSALKGCKLLLSQIDYIITEVNYGELYEKNSKIYEIDEYLLSFGFVRIDTYSSTKGWGDALYIRKALLKNTLR